MHQVKTVRALEDYRLHVQFTDGTEGTVSLRDRLFGPMFAPLQDVALFQQAAVDEFGAICWPNGADLAPDALYHQLRSASVGSPAGKAG